MLTKGLLPVWMVVPFVLKEIVTFTGGFLVSKKMSKAVVSNIFGKITVVFFYGAILVCMLARDYLAEHVALLYLISGLVLSATMAALVNYIIYAAKMMKSSEKKPEEKRA